MQGDDRQKQVCNQLSIPVLHRLVARRTMYAAVSAVPSQGQVTNVVELLFMKARCQQVHKQARLGCEFQLFKHFNMQ